MAPYVSIEEMKAYLPVSTVNAQDDTVLQDAIDWAEDMFTSLAGSRFDQQSVTNETPVNAFADRHTVLTIIARTVAPVTAVSRVAIMIPNVFNWTTLTWDANNIQLPPVASPPSPKAWTAKIFLTGSMYLSQTDTNNLWVSWDYTGGYSTIPSSLKHIIQRMALWKYKLREVPLGRINSEMFGTREIIQSLPNDIRMDITRWTRMTTG